MKPFFRILLLLLPVFCLALPLGCANKTVEITSTVSEDEKFGAAELALSPEELEAAGFRLGDSLDIVFGNGYALNDVPYYNGYYAQAGYPVLVAYPGFACVRVNLSFGQIWETAGLKNGDSVTVRLREAGKYLHTYEALGQDYSVIYEEYDCAEEFCNFRSLVGGHIKEGLLYRGASPVDNARNRAPYTDKLIEAKGISFIVDLADNAENYAAYLAEDSFDSPYTAGLYKAGHVVMLDMNAIYEAEEFHLKVAEGLKCVAESEGPVYIHCQEGKDRTGYVCIILEALAGASYEELKADYMKTYENYYGITPDGTPERYQAVVDTYFDPFMEYLHKTDDSSALQNADFSADATEYLLDGGMTDAEIAALNAFIRGEN